LKFYELFLALRYLKGSRRTMGGSLTSVIAVAGVTVGVAALIATLAVMTGFREDIRAKILGAQPHLLIQPASEVGLPAQDYADRFSGVAAVVAWSPYVMGQTEVDPEFIFIDANSNSAENLKALGVIESYADILLDRNKYVLIYIKQPSLFKTFTKC